LAYIDPAAAAAASAESAEPLADDHRAELYYQAATHRLDQARHRQFANARATLQAVEAHKETDCLRPVTATAVVRPTVHIHLDDINVADLAGPDASPAAASPHQAAGM